MPVAGLTKRERAACVTLGNAVKSNDVKRIRRAMRACADALARRDRPDPAKDRPAFLRSLLLDAERALAHAAADGSHQAVFHGQREIRMLGETIANEVGTARGTSTRAEDMDEDEYVEELRLAADEMAEKHLRVFVDSWMDRHRMVAVARSA